MKLVILAVTALVLVGVLVVVPGRAAISRGQLAPDFHGVALDGRKVNLSAFRGKSPVVLNFFGAFCAPCREEFPHFRELDEKYGAKGLKVIGVSLDEDRISASVVPNESRTKFPVLFDPKGAIAAQYGVQVLPHTVVIDRSGKLHAILMGVDLKALDAAVEQVLR